MDDLSELSNCHHVLLYSVRCSDFPTGLNDAEHPVK